MESRSTSIGVLYTLPPRLRYTRFQSKSPFSPGIRRLTRGGGGLRYLPPPVYKTPPQVTGFLYWSLIQDIPSHKFSLLESYTSPKVESYFGHLMHIPRCNKHGVLFSSHGIALLESYTSYPQVTGILYWSLIQTPNPGVLYTGGG